ncbi:hypothetical protein K432DRAFT_392794 [Lepidopterella palustris CBS 459.81]|uniref:Uncharacterized protein n=1 Tax=Lepidopterella palustris CBS 459.81 TaxID=1314670 RepID=A0A8E2JFK0_9PEZI|nr:hypothetical protein K432DRAFT_392794 [Lepidopterella palustris CBS 459.81]
MRDATGPSRSILDGSGTLLGDFDVAKLYCEVSHDYIMLGIGIVDRLSLISETSSVPATHEPKNRRNWSNYKGVTSNSTSQSDQGTAHAETQREQKVTESRASAIGVVQRLLNHASAPSSPSKPLPTLVPPYGKALREACMARKRSIDYHNGDILAVRYLTGVIWFGLGRGFNLVRAAFWLRSVWLCTPERLGRLGEAF